MRLIRYQDRSGAIGHGSMQSDGTVLAIAGDVYSSRNLTDVVVEVERVLAPVRPPTIFGIGLNYRHHAEESGMAIPAHPVVFFKATTAVLDPGAPIEIPVGLKSLKVDYECELAVVIGKRCKNVSRADAMSYILGYTCANDVSARDWQIDWGGSQWSRGKTFDTFCPLGPAIVTADEIQDPNRLGIRTVLNGEIVQDWNTSDMIFDVATLVEFLSGSTTLLPGTVILTGTPHGVGMASNPPRWLSPGDEVTIEIDSIGSLTNTVINEPLNQANS